jgi:hypothetical protein
MSMRVTGYNFTFAVAVVLAGCSKKDSPLGPSPEKNPFVVETKSAGEFVIDLHKQGLLPGDSKDSHGDILSPVTLPLPKSVSYPFSNTFLIVFTGESYTNNYCVLRASKNAPWQLQKAWRTGPDGKTVAEWPVK